jgi:hypothetical protein
MPRAVTSRCCTSPIVAEAPGTARRRRYHCPASHQKTMQPAGPHPALTMV